ncbi:adenylate/guanylate cyclase domain-containing protein [Pseudobacteriovorax antillogorgiicola]|uniref:Adenylate and Guanylate cyclase catalytic domain-containing protein n=1 Tax=Pseudobacteriovorax antillogorgiicola TaxID=1513793 RepID=A0A1Y6CJ23_9BACT|nr:adenylate/guanylate cyclase domain-containing protein [Pseudobacteriovorax antillogorgiicola]TCS48226.1 adenylate/guanylate cyclase family protein [Pseudobacteriovorax antillogorgiicola]SMF57349.1 Adenylate and Guanylate cyclase catalytic domain-containing protein [Pseudobacteriovorax antillogorgiicola]
MTSLLRILLSLILCNTYLLAVPKDPVKYWSNYQKRTEKLFEQLAITDSSKIDEIKSKLPQFDDGSDSQYLLYRQLSEYSNKFCTTMIRPDDLAMRARCKVYNEVDEVSWDTLYEMAKQSSVSEQAHVIRSRLRDAAMKGDIVAARGLQKYIKDIPDDAIFSHLLIKRSLANHFINPTNDLETIESGIEMLKETLEIDPDSSIAFFNIGIAYLLNLNRPSSALEWLLKAREADDGRVDKDTSIFLALAYVELGDTKLAIEELEKPSEAPEPYRAKFLKCYEEYIIFRIRGFNDLKSCLTLSGGVQIDALLDIIERINKLDLSTQQKVLFFDNYKNLIHENLLPLIRDNAESSARTIALNQKDHELKINRLELAKKQEELKSQRYLRLSIIGLSLLVLMIAYLLFRMKHRAQTIRILKEQTRANSEQMAKDHAYSEFNKIIYPHQLALIKKGRKIEDSMPCEKSRAAVISFDIQNSSKLGHGKHHDFFEKILKKCYQRMNESYEEHNISANAYMIKEMGDGFLCSVGFPFKCQGDVALQAYSLAISFVKILNETAAVHFPNHNVYCGIGISYGDVYGYFPKIGLKQYDLYGDAIVHAKRYESMRRYIFDTLKVERGNIIIFQEAFLEQLPLKIRRKLVKVKLNSVKVRDDSQASHLSYLLMPGHRWPLPKAEGE